MPNDPPDAEWPDLDDWYRENIERAKKGYRESAIELIEEIARTDPKAGLPILLQEYIASCLSAWLDFRCDPDKSSAAFNLQRAADGGRRD